jgi:hypothetical protein
MRTAKILITRLFSGIVVLTTLTCHTALTAQTTLPNKMRFLEFSYGFQWPMADMQERFGANNNINLAFQSAWMDSKLLAGAELLYFFGNTVKEDVVASLRSFDGHIVGIDGTPGEVRLKERGFYTGISLAKVFAIGKSDRLTGIRFQVGGGLLQHKIRVQDDFNNVVPLDNKYLNGYDRLTNGPAVKVALGFQYQHPQNNAHFYILGDWIGGFTKSRRDFDYATGGYLDGNRFDALIGVRAAYIVTISSKGKSKVRYY